MATEETPQTEAEVKPAAPKKQRAPRKKAAATQASGEAGAPAASAEAAAPAPKKQRAPRKKAAKPAAEAPLTDCSVHTAPSGTEFAVYIIHFLTSFSPFYHGFSPFSTLPPRFFVI